MISSKPPTELINNTNVKTLVPRAFSLPLPLPPTPTPDISPHISDEVISDTLETVNGGVKQGQFESLNYSQR